MTRTWSIDLPDQPILTPNSRSHWSRRAECASLWRSAAAVMARASRIPTIDRASLRLEHWPRTHRRMDPDRLSLVAKWAVDGIVDAGVLVDDDSRHVTEVAMRLHQPRPDRIPAWLLTITEVVS